MKEEYRVSICRSTIAGGSVLRHNMTTYQVDGRSCKGLQGQNGENVGREPHFGGEYEMTESLTG